MANNFGKNFQPLKWYPEARPKGMAPLFLLVTLPPRAAVNQHPPVHPEGWMVSGQETVFCSVPVP